MSGDDDDDEPVPSIAYVEDDVESVKETVIGALAPTHLDSRVPFFVVVGGKRSVGKIFRLRDGITIGRALTCEILLEDEGVSRRHARVGISRGTTTIEDLGSSNGIFHLGQRVQSVALNEGDHLQIGDAAVALLRMDDVEDPTRKDLESATEDPETKLLVRRRFLQLVAQELTFGTSLSVALLAIDGYRSLVDTHGMRAGAQLLRSLASLVQAIAQREDVLLGRYADDTLAVMLPETAREDALRFAELTRRGVETGAVVYDGKPLGFTVSAGVATAPGGASATTTAQSIADAAELGVYRAKLDGRNRVAST